MTHIPKLSVAGLTLRTTERTVLDNVSLEVEGGKIVSVLGPNGAGKSELVLSIGGMLPITGGEIHLDDVRLQGRAAEVVRDHGIAAVPEGHHVLTKLSVDDNLKAAGSMHDSASLISLMEEAYAIFPELVALKQQRAGMLSGGQQ